ncbi:MAG: L,D-transpeptidase [Methyloprofundus sp.]|nr:L,D-transpeptidase [Methyloprofundus sp.]
MRYSLFLFCLLFTLSATAKSPLWLLVDTQRKQIEVKEGSLTMHIFKSISLGRKGAGFKQKQGDDITPIGSYKIVKVANTGSRFRRFFGINYPLPKDALYAVRVGSISFDEYLAIMQAHSKAEMPPGNTNIGGQIGIHGIGRGNPKVQGVFDWTHGCIALSNQQIDKLAGWVYLGMPVIIK